MFRPVAVLLLAAQTHALWHAADSSEQELCLLALGMKGTVVLPNATCCWGQVEAAGYECHDGGEGSSYENASWSYFPDCDIYNPAAYIMAQTPEDVRRAMLYIRLKKLAFRVKSGGHAANCHSKCDGDCVVLSVENMKTMEFITTEENETFMSIEPGAKLKEIYESYMANSNAYFPHGSCHQVAAGGHIASGSVGYLTRKFGMGADFVVGAEFVLPNGKLIEVFDPEVEETIRGHRTSCNARHQDLLWALRGNGQANFAVTTKFWMKTIPRPNFIVLGVYRYELTPESVKHYWKATCDFYQSPNNETRGGRNLIAWPLVAQANPGDPHTMDFMFYYIPDNNETAMGALSEATPVVERFVAGLGDLKLVSAQLYPVTPSQQYARFYVPKARTVYHCTSRVVVNREDVCGNAEWMDAFAERVYREAQPSNWYPTGTTFWTYHDPWGGAVTENDPDYARTSFSHRHSWGVFTYCRIPLTGVDFPRPVLKEMIREVNETMMAPLGNVYYMGYKSQTTTERNQLYPVPEVYRKLQQVKKAYDPTNVFDVPLNVELP